ncbi:hypothetical protein L195_g001927 [Trifolium pratense]|uniref:Uncharacterized protein n=1 Tax=Trifolium pratense TaxID=57577 RepID=A0A2K3NR14_TRIPR|nr:hypothetical protein L195_g001927 [Trifolium pratense]
MVERRCASPLVGISPLPSQPLLSGMEFVPSPVEILLPSLLVYFKFALMVFDVRPQRYVDAKEIILSKDLIVVAANKSLFFYTQQRNHSCVVSLTNLDNPYSRSARPQAKFVDIREKIRCSFKLELIDKVGLSKFKFIGSSFNNIFCGISRPEFFGDCTMADGPEPPQLRLQRQSAIKSRIGWQSEIMFCLVHFPYPMPDRREYRNYDSTPPSLESFMFHLHL